MFSKTVAMHAYTLASGDCSVDLPAYRNTPP